MRKLLTTIKQWWAGPPIPPYEPKWWEGVMTFYETFDGGCAILINGRLFTQVSGQWTKEDVNLWTASQSQPSSTDDRRCQTPEQP